VEGEDGRGLAPLCEILNTPLMDGKRAVAR